MGFDELKKESLLPQFCEKQNEDTTAIKSIQDSQRNHMRRLIVIRFNKASM